MAIREYKCECKYLWEVVMPMAEDIPPEKECPKCGKMGKFQFPRVAILTSSFQNNTIDVQVGADADRKWQAYHDRQEERNRVRKETGSMALTAIDGAYIPTPESVRDLRESAAAARSNGTDGLEESYYRSEVENPSAD